MTPRPRHLALGLVLSLAVAFTIDASASAAGSRAVRPTDARVVSPFLMHGRVRSALRVHGERRGQRITRHWMFTGLSCAGNVCRQLSLLRERSANHYSRIVIHRTGVGRYAGSSRFYAALKCRGKLYPRGEEVPYRITVKVTQVVSVQGIRFARKLTATYTNRRRIDRTKCPIGPSHDAARYTGVASLLPSPPMAEFSASVNPSTDGAQFTDTSSPGVGGAPIVSRQWQFGDPASGAGDTADTPAPAHAFSAPGVYGVSLTVTDANGLSSTTTQQVTAPGPPTAAFIAASTGAPLTYSFADRSRPGIGGAGIVAWLWNFGDPASGSADESALNDPQHTFTAPGSYPVCLTVRDSSGRVAGTCAQVLVSAVRAQSEKRSVSNATESSAASRSGRLRTGEITAYRQNGRPD
jgi:PKD repeat protein